MRPACAYGSDCADCGVRTQCSPEGASFEVPREALARASRPLRFPQVLFLIMGSARLNARSLLVATSWCSRQQVGCLFFREDVEQLADGAPLSEAEAVAQSAAGWPAGVPSVRVTAPMPAHSCCRHNATRPGRREDFFCRAHRAMTLSAQYRYLPALQYVRSSAAFAAGRFRWIVLVDDDSFVFGENLRRLLEVIIYV